MSRNIAPVIAAEALLHHGLSDEAVAAYLARTWPLEAVDCRSAVDAAHILLRRTSPPRRIAEVAGAVERSARGAAAFGES